MMLYIFLLYHFSSKITRYFPQKTPRFFKKKLPIAYAPREKKIPFSGKFVTFHKEQNFPRFFQKPPQSIQAYGKLCRKCGKPCTFKTFQKKFSIGRSKKRQKTLSSLFQKKIIFHVLHKSGIA